ncbi:malto-oligosyltrehalose synthase [Kushneria phosphatilytica]|uniref:Malto-oligosyltrehalose synthase n=1 Tax=Kushneria phosphatilytica TaxID=657387 RepID=A0A1S1NYV9_9GAMM|nr:malto-oligosyltrehalose synthase [Kushneria phosphatilytica]OHV10575.1 malto-oligosyltrehalose synthase [Kushneria phosphatilytica]QEL11849.1 malto-oligosyltrehalose synthase [Kushneria phosphatilytica]
MTSLRATLRLQFHPGFTLDDACELVDYCSALGISHLYASPLLKSRTDSTHGYDGVDPTRIDPQLGGEEALARLVERLHARDMGLIMDIVPNHLAIGHENPWWQDVLQMGQQSAHAHFFDIDWHSPDPALQGRMLLPLLGDTYGSVLRSGELQPGFDAELGELQVSYHEHRFPLAMHSLGPLLESAGASSLAALANALPLTVDEAESARAGVAELRTALQQWLTQSSARDALARVLADHDGSTPERAERLHALLERQWYRLAWWRAGNDELNWRRFFDVTELAGVRVELPDVFEAVHARVFDLIERGWVDGVRIDHVDGLADPRGYCLQLRTRLDELAARRPVTTRTSAPDRLPILVEKILAEDEQLHDDWGVDGDTGYAFMNSVNALQHRPDGEAPLAALWSSLSGRTADFSEETVRSRRLMLKSLLASEFEGTVRALRAVACSHPDHRDLTTGMIRRALRELVVQFGIYRTYADDHGRPVQDEPHFQRALKVARYCVEPPGQQVLDALECWLGSEAPVNFPEPERTARLRAITRFQQLTSPVAAKAVEDTAGYRCAVLLSRSDVGFEADTFSMSVERFHAANQDRHARFPHAMLTTATHDHKRGEDVRARLAALSEWASVYTEAVRQWFVDASALRGRTASTGGVTVMPADELMLYQILVGAWPLDLLPDDEAGMTAFAERIEAWQQKALREAKLNSHWLYTNEPYEQACRDFTRGLLTSPEMHELRHSIHGMAMRIAPTGAINSLVQTLLRMTAPGMPDLYQGTEYWDFSLVDPDNRRPVDFEARQRTLASSDSLVELQTHWQDGRIKQALIHGVLMLRQRYPVLFAEGEYLPLSVEGEGADQVVAFQRRHGQQQLVVVAARHAGTMSGEGLQIDPECWGRTRIRWFDESNMQVCRMPWKDWLTGRTIVLHCAESSLGRCMEQSVTLGRLLAELPFCLLVRDDAGDP